MTIADKQKKVFITLERKRFQTFFTLVRPIMSSLLRIALTKIFPCHVINATNIRSKILSFIFFFIRAASKLLRHNVFANLKVYWKMEAVLSTATEWKFTKPVIDL